jgi:hypothetical protein
LYQGGAVGVAGGVTHALSDVRTNNSPDRNTVAFIAEEKIELF